MLLPLAATARCKFPNVESTMVMKLFKSISPNLLPIKVELTTVEFPDTLSPSRHDLELLTTVTPSNSRLRTLTVLMADPVSLPQLMRVKLIKDRLVILLNTRPAKDAQFITDVDILKLIFMERLLSIWKPYLACDQLVTTSELPIIVTL